MAGISDTIELFILDLMGESGDVELGRNELAQYFGCAPSQINYVLSTRFTLDKGYFITSKRGGGGSVKIVRAVLDENDFLAELVSTRLGSEVSIRDAAAVIGRLLERRTITEREAILMNVICGDYPMAAPGVQDYIRATLLKRMIVELIRKEQGDDL